MGSFEERSGYESWIQVSMVLGYHEKRKDQDKGVRPGGSTGRQHHGSGPDFGGTKIQKQCFGESLKERFRKILRSIKV